MPSAEEYQELVRTHLDAAKSGRIDESRRALMDLYNEIVDDGHDELLPEICEAVGIVFFEGGSYRDSLVWLNRALALCVQLDDRRREATVMGNIGRVHHVHGDLEQAIRSYQTSRAALLDVQELHAAATTDVNLAMLYEVQGDFPRAMEAYHRALDIFTEKGSWFGMAHVCNGLAQLYYDSADHEEAVGWARKSLGLYVEHQNVKGEISSTSAIARSMVRLGESDEAIALLRAAIAKGTSPDVRREVAVAQIALAEALIRCKMYDEARRVIGQARPVAEELEAALELATIDYARAEIEREHGNVEYACELYESALPIVLRIGHSNLARKIYDGLHRALRETDPKRALLNLERAVELKEEVLGEQKRRRVALLEMEHKISQERREHERQIAEERALRDQQRELLINVMPPSVADRLISGETFLADAFESATVIFFDLVQFTRLSSSISAGHVVHVLNAIFREVDKIIASEGLTKIKTIGDAYMAVGGVPDPMSDHTVRTARAAIRIQQTLDALEIKLPPELGEVDWGGVEQDLQLRTGIHTGPLTAGVIGEHRIAYDIWGDTVNVASRMEQTSEPGRIQVTQAVVDLLGTLDDLQVEPRGVVDVKGKGQMQTYWLTGV